MGQTGLPHRVVECPDAYAIDDDLGPALAGEQLAHVDFRTGFRRNRQSGAETVEDDPAMGSAKVRSGSISQT